MIAKHLKCIMLNNTGHPVAANHISYPVNCWQRSSSFVSAADADSLVGAPPTPYDLYKQHLRNHNPLPGTYFSKIKYYGGGIEKGRQYFAYSMS